MNIKRSVKQKIFVRYIEVLCYTLIYERTPQLGKLFLLPGPALCFCFPVQVSRFLFRFLQSGD